MWGLLEAAEDEEADSPCQRPAHFNPRSIPADFLPPEHWDA